MQNQKKSAKAGRHSSEGSSHNLQREGERKVLHDAPTTPGMMLRAPVSITVARQVRRQRAHARHMLRLLREFYEFGLLRDRGRQNTSLPAGCVLAVRYQSR